MLKDDKHFVVAFPEVLAAPPHLRLERYANLKDSRRILALANDELPDRLPPRLLLSCKGLTKALLHNIPSMDSYYGGLRE